MIRLLICAVPNGLKLVVINSALILVGGYGRVQLSLLGFAVFAKRSKLVVCSDRMRRAVAELASLIEGALSGYVGWVRLGGVGCKALSVSNNLGLSLGFGRKVVVKLLRNVEASVFGANKLGLGSADLDVVATAASALNLRDALVYIKRRA